MIERFQTYGGPEPDPILCIRWGQGPDRCVKLFDHCGACLTAGGETTLTKRDALLVEVLRQEGVADRVVIDAAGFALLAEDLKDFTTRKAALVELKRRVSRLSAYLEQV